MGKKYIKRTVLVMLAGLIVAAMASVAAAQQVTINTSGGATLNAGSNSFDLGQNGWQVDQDGSITVDIQSATNVGSISGTVDSTGILVYVYLQPHGASNGGALYRTVAVDGGFNFSGVPYGTYTLILVCPGHPEVQFTPDPTSNPVTLSSTNRSVNLNFTADVATSCTYSYSAWGACQSNGTQTRTVLSSSPSGCVGTPVTNQSCTYNPGATACTSWSYSAWGACQSNNTQTRTVTASYPSGCVGSPSSSLLTQSCTYNSGGSGGAMNLGASGAVTNGTIAANGENNYYFTLPGNVASSVTVSMLSADWATNQDLIVGLTQPKCSDITGRYSMGTNGFWYGPVASSNETLTLYKSFSAGTTLYVAVCNRSATTGKYTLKWTSQ